MSGCAGKGLSLADLTELPIGSVRDNKGTGDCTPSIAGTQPGSGYDRCVGHAQFKYPQNGEFDFALGSPCGMSAWVWEYGCSGGGIGGSRCAVRRSKYLADPTQCCLRQALTVGPHTCDPKYRVSPSDACDPLMLAYCDNPVNFFSDGCKAWMQSLSKNSGKIGTLNLLANKYCPGSTDEFCACYNVRMRPELTTDSAKAIFRCLDPQCAGQNALNTLNCPLSYVECNQDNINVLLQKTEVEKIQIAQECGNLIVNPDPGNGGGGGGGNSSSSTPWLAIGVGGGVIALIIIIVIIIIVISQAKTKSK
jgi:hypothetical protein